jgi:hypothetical protein
MTRERTQDADLIELLEFLESWTDKADELAK